MNITMDNNTAMVIISVFGIIILAIIAWKSL